MIHILLVLSLSGPAPGADGDRWFGPDKVKHFFSSMFVANASYATLRLVGAGHGASLLAADGVAGAVGVGKELMDRRTGGDPSLRDLAWDAAGIGAATVVLRRSR